jgi:phosphohistidine phosphatase
MKRLTLIRHGKSSWKDPELADFDRPLNKRGKDDAPEMGKRIAARRCRPDLIITSPAKRAVSTVKRIAGETGFPESGVVKDERLYGAGAREILRVVQEIDDLYGDVVLCGHNPGLTDFCTLVSDLVIDTIPTCGVVSIDFPGDSWSDVVAGAGILRYFDCPKRVGE